jgi:SAM-dependent methyltransferase
VLELLEEARGDRPKSDIRILDHGCGGGKLLIYILANGYEGIYGVDVSGPWECLNRLTNGHLGLPGKRFFNYDGKTLPFDDGTFDFIFSTQVIEHVHDDVLESYYAEEARVLAAGGMVYHQVPHRLVPYDSHSRTWFLHYLPRRVWIAALRALGHKAKGYEETMWLRWPWIHRRLARRYLGPLEDRTMERFLGLTDFTHYDGPKGLRSVLARIVRLPVIGTISRAALKNFVMIDTISRAPKTEDGAGKT